MQKRVIKELLLFTLILTVLTLIMHSDLLTDPVSRFSTMSERENFYHPFIYTSIVYFTVLFMRLLTLSLKTLINKFKNR